MRAWRITVMSALGLIAVMGAGCGGECGPFEPQIAVIMSGDYAGQEILDNGAQAFPHSGGEQFRLSVDRENAVVEVRYVLQGAEVVERWRLQRSQR